MLKFSVFKNKKSAEDEALITQLKPILGYRPKNIYYFKKAFTHSSVNKIIDDIPFNYERLEFLGDSLLDTIVSCYLYNKVPNQNEGYLTKMRSKIVSRENLNFVGKKLDLVKCVHSNVDKSKFGDNIFGNLYESITAAVFLDKGFKGCENFIYRTLINPHVDIERLEGKITSYKSVLMEWCQKQKKEIDFNIYEDNNPKEKEKFFAVKLSINKKVVSKGRATSKKKAEEIASKRAYFSFQDRINN